MKQITSLQIALITCVLAGSGSTVAANVFSVAQEGIKPFQTKENVSAATVDDFRSLHSITATQLREVQEIVPEAELFEVDAYLQPEGGVLAAIVVHSLFSSPHDEQRYVDASDTLGSPQRHYYSTGTKAFVVRHSRGPTRDDGSGQPTGEPEARQKHLPIQNWIMDISDLERIWKENEIGFALRGEFIITTVGRFKYKPPRNGGPVFKQSDRVTHLPDGRAIIVVVGPTGPYNRLDGTFPGSGPYVPMGSGSYVVVDAQSGEILVRGSHFSYPPRS